MTGASARVTLDGHRCMASGLCAQIAPEIFALHGGQNAAVVKVAELHDPDLLELADEAEESCPAMAIAVHRQN